MKEQTMKKALAVCLALLAVLAIAAAGASAADAKRPSDLKYPKLTLETPEYQEIQFDNGMTGFFLEDHEIPVVEIQMLIPTSRAPRDKTGLNDLGAWVIRNGGSENWPAEKINEELEFTASRLEFRGGDRSASINLNCLTKDLDVCLSILGDVLSNPLLPDDKIELRRGTMLENIRRENDDPRTVARREFRKIVYGDHPMAWEPTAESVSSITRGDIVAYHDAYFRPNNAIIGITGDVTKEEIMAALDDAFAGWQSAPVTIVPEPEFKPTFTPSVNYVYKDINQAVILIGHLGLNSHDENRVPVDLMNFILGGGSFTSRITQKVRTDEGLAYAAYSQYTEDPWTYGLFIASSQTKSEAAGRAIELILDIIKTMHDEGPTQDEFARARDTYLNNHVFDYESNSAVIRRLVRLKWQRMPLDSAEQDFRRFTDLKLGEVTKAARDYLHPDGLTILVVGNEALFDQPLSNFGPVNVIELRE
jgi:zinc protease